MARRATGFWVYADTVAVVIPPPPRSFVARPVVAFGHYLVRVGRADGTIIGELHGALETAAWRSDGYGMASMVVPAAAFRAAPELFQFGNTVRIDFDSGLRPWVGVIDPPREMLYDAVRVSMYESAYTLSWRVTPQQRVSTSYEDVASAGLIHTLLRESGLPFPTSYYSWPDAPLIDIAFDSEVVLAAIARVQEMDPELHYDTAGDSGPTDSTIRPALRLWRGVRDDATARVVLRAGHNFVTPTILEQGPIVNQFIVETKMPESFPPAGPPVLDVADEPQHGPTFVGNDRLSQGAHALRQAFVVLPDVDEELTPGAGRQYADAQAAKQGRPRLRIAGTSLNVSPGLWRNFSTGSRIALEVYHPRPMMLAATVLGMEYAPATGQLALVLSDAEPV